MSPTNFGVASDKRYLLGLTRHSRMYSPEEQRVRLLQQANQAQIDRYWERNAPLTFAVLIACVGASALIQPIRWPYVLGLALSGIVLFLGTRLDKRGHQLVGGLLMIASVILTCIMIGVGEMRGSLMWVQAFGLMFAAFCGSLLFHKAALTKEESE